MTTLLVLTLGFFLFATYRALTDAAEAAARDRLTRAARQIATTIEQSTQVRSEQLLSIAKDSALVRALRLKLDTAPTTPAAPPRRVAATPAARRAAARAPRTPTPVEIRRAAREVLSGILIPVRSGLTIELWDPFARRVTYTGANLRAPGAAVLPPFARFALLEKGGPPADSVRWGPLHGHKGSTYYWGIVPVKDRDSTAGYVAMQRRVLGPAQSAGAFADILGPDVTMSLRNRSGSFVSRAPDLILNMPPRDSTPRGVIQRWPELGRTFVGEAPVNGTPWVVMLDTPVDLVLAGPRATIQRLALIGLGLTLFAALVAWLLGRRIARPMERRVTEAEDANRAKTEFLAAMSHELRTPLNAIGGYAQLLEMEVHGPLTDAQRDTLARLGRSQFHLTSLINDVLNFARIDAGHVQYRIDEVSAADALRGAELMIAPQLRAKALTLESSGCDDSLRMLADAERLQQILLNLLANAIKFTPSGGTVTMGCRLRDELVEIRIGDTGPGIPAARLETIFQPFVRGDRALDRANEGAGLGLTISRDLARGMGGDLLVESVEGEGSTFTLRLPSATPRTPAERPPAAVPVSAEGSGSRG